MHSDIVNTVAYEASIGSGSWSDIVKSDDIQSRRRFFIACGIQAMQQLGGKQFRTEGTAGLACESFEMNEKHSPLGAHPTFFETSLTHHFFYTGINALIYYSNTLFSKSLGFDAELSSLMSGFLNTWFFAASFIPCKPPHILLAFDIAYRSHRADITRVPHRSRRTATTATIHDQRHGCRNDSSDWSHLER